MTVGLWTQLPSLPGCQVLVLCDSAPGRKHLTAQGLTLSFGALEGHPLWVPFPCGCTSPNEGHEALGKDVSEGWSEADFPLRSAAPWTEASPWSRPGCSLCRARCRVKVQGHLSKEPDT